MYDGVCMVEDCDSDKVTVTLPIDKDTAAKLKAGESFTATIKGKVCGAIAREGDATRWDPSGEVRLEVESVTVDSKDQMEAFADEMLEG